ncbi:reverse transcriptase domain-containing protein [Tanacetum coccineum]
MAFSFTLKGRARQWMKQLSIGSITTWVLFKDDFLSKYLPSQIIKQINAIRSFEHKSNKPLHFAWERFSDSLYNCPEHKINEHEQLQIFYQGLDTKTRRKADFKGPIPKMTPINGIKAIIKLSKHSLSWYKEGDIKNNGINIVFKQINNFKQNINVIIEEVRMIHHRYEIPVEGRMSKLEETLSTFIKESLRRWRARTYENIPTKEVALDSQRNITDTSTPHISFPRRLKKEKEKEQFQKFIENLQRLSINIPYIEALEQMPKYAKFMKDLLAKKGKINEASRITLNERCSVVVLNKIPLKERDPGSFTIPCVIGQSGITNALINNLWDDDEVEQDLTNQISHELKFDDYAKPTLFSANTFEEKQPTTKLKDLPSHLEYAFLDNNQEFPVIISSLLSTQEKELLLGVLARHKGALAWKVADIKVISPSFCTYKFLMDDNFKPVVQPQRRLNPKVQDLVKAKIVKLLDAGLIYAIFDSPWSLDVGYGLITRNSMMPQGRIILLYLSLIKCWNDCLGMNIIAFWMGFWDTSKFYWHLKTKKKLPSLVLIGHLLKGECPSDYVMLPPHSSGA